MTSIKALRLQLQNLPKENQELGNRNLKISWLRKSNKIREERNHWNERVTAENVQLKALYEVLYHVSVDETTDNPSS